MKMKGKVKCYSPDKKYGFIIGEDGKDYFVHASKFQGTLNKDDEVFFNPIQVGDKMQAHNVVKEAK